MKLVEYLEIHREPLNFLRKNGIKIQILDHLDMYHYYKAERANPRNTYDKVMDNIKRIYGIGHTKVLEVVKTLDREMQTFDL